MESLLHENDALAESKIEEKASEGELIVRAFFEAGNVAMTFSEYVMGNAFITYLAKRTKVGVINFERGDVTLSSDRSHNIKLVPQ